MAVVAVATGLVVAGGVLLAPSDSSSLDEIAKKVGFDHPEKYKQLHEGAGHDAMTEAANSLRGEIKEHFGNALELLETANREAGIAWQGQAAEQFGDSTKPMTSFLTNAQSTSQSAGDSVHRQVEAFLRVRDAMPEPKKVDATDSLAEKGGAWLVGSETDLQQQERQATAAAQQAKQTYDTYDNDVRGEVQNPPRFAPAPGQNGGGQGGGPSGGGPAVNSPTGVGPGGGAPGIGGGNSGFVPGGSNLPGAGNPADSGSAWAPGSGSTPSGGGSAGPGAGGPGGAAGAGGGAAAGMVGGGMGAGAGAGAASKPGAGGRAGVGSPGSGGAAGGGAAGAKGAGAGGRGGMGPMGGMGGRGAQGGGDDDQEHESWLEEQDDVWLNDMPRTAPPVFGE